MLFKFAWQLAPKCMSLPVSPELPSDFVEDYAWSFVKQLRVASNSKSEFAYFCPYNECNGWILGEPIESEEYFLSRNNSLSGRDGTAYYCCRCKHEVGFAGRVS